MARFAYYHAPKVDGFGRAQQRHGAEHKVSQALLHISGPRSVAMYVARRLTKAAWREIGQYFGGRDHSTVVAASKRVDEWITDSVPVGQPNSCRGTTWDEVVQEIEDRLMSMAS